jgi:hypothetical protein
MYFSKLYALFFLLFIPKSLFATNNSDSTVIILETNSKNKFQNPRLLLFDKSRISGQELSIKNAGKSIHKFLSLDKYSLVRYNFSNIKQFEFLVKQGDSLMLQVNNEDISATILNRETRKYDLNLDSFC